MTSYVRPEQHALAFLATVEAGDLGLYGAFRLWSQQQRLTTDERRLVWRAILDARRDDLAGGVQTIVGDHAGGMRRGAA